ncbi:MAG: hypothetical protein Q9202_002945 [Teloschistes flavicans]
MPSAKAPRAQTTGSSNFVPDAFFETWAKDANALLPRNNDLRTSIISAFNLAQSDSYVYHAIASVTLAQVQEAIDHGAENGMHAWYPHETDQPPELPPPPPPPPPAPADILAYTSIFASTTSTPKALTAFSANAKKGSHRAAAATYLQSKRFLSPNTSYTIPKRKTPHINPYHDYWTWSCQNLEWAGPTPSTAGVKHSHAILPVLMHHFGCVCPSYESLEIIKRVANHGDRQRKVLDLGSGNGYWTYMLRRLGGLQVEAVDNLSSRYRTLWIDDTVVEEGEAYLRARRGARDAVLLLVYPIVGAEFTKRVLEAYEGSAIVIAGTQNANGYTGFRDRVVDEWMAAMKPAWEKRVQVALPSFAGKDEALWVFEKVRGE